MEADAAYLVNEACLDLRTAGENAKKKHGKNSSMPRIGDWLATDKVNQELDTEMQLIRKADKKFQTSILKIESREINGNHHKPSVQFDRDRGDSPSSYITAMSQARAPECSRGFDSGLMRRASARLVQTDQTEPEPWKLVEKIASESKNLDRRVATKYKVASGRWSMPRFGKVCRGLRRKICALLMWSHDNSTEVTNLMARDSTYAVGKFVF
jgi:hypothetical protein